MVSGGGNRRATGERGAALRRPAQWAVRTQRRIRSEKRKGEEQCCERDVRPTVTYTPTFMAIMARSTRAVETSMSRMSYGLQGDDWLRPPPSRARP